MPVKKKVKKEDSTKVKSNIKILYLVVICCWFAGAATSLVLRVKVEPLITITPVVDAFLITISVFVFSMLFFGYVAPLFMFAIGMMQGVLLEQDPIRVILAAPIMLAAYAGVISGIYLLRDMQGKDNFFNYKKTILTCLITAAVLSIVMSLILENMHYLIPATA